MKILGYEIPPSVQSDNFIEILSQEYAKKGKLSFRQEETLRNILHIHEDYVGWGYDLPPELESYRLEFEKLKAKVERDKFTSISSKNLHIRALNSLLCGEPRNDLIDKIFVNPF